MLVMDGCICHVVDKGSGCKDVVCVSTVSVRGGERACFCREVKWDE